MTDELKVVCDAMNADKYGLSEDEDVYLEHVKSLAELHEESGIALVKAN
ncbi:hypothetical protein [Vibrio metschnikovii]|uniref:Uncharacterized protein n=1 Tax=Vibrio metschnikovii TaxID=28172 RepID=A0A9X0R993_VIBME|nr:hypothetical protein [Vibrio metschnikovii]MBC5852134.1 hypothetical protein [Vibrio metschnikovii]